MSGYLESLTRQILQPTATIRPLAGSVFSSPSRNLEHDAPAGVSFGEEESFSAALALPLSPPPAVQRSIEPEPRSLLPTVLDPPVPAAGMNQPWRAAAPRERDPSPATPASSQSPVQASSASASTGMAAPPQRPVPPAALHNPAAIQPAPLLRLLPRTAMAQDKDSGFQPREQSPAGREVAPRPLMPTEEHPPNSGPAQRAISTESAPPFTPVNEGARLLQPQRLSPVPLGATRTIAPPPPPREPDEIHIHIGRIEITAALPAPTPRPVSAPSRKGPDLSAYLKRGRAQ